MASFKTTSSGETDFPPPFSVALLTGGDDRSYALGITEALVAQGINVDFIGSDALDAPLVRSSPRIRFLNLRRDQNRDASLGRKIRRIIAYYVRLVCYAATSPCPVFHILWNNKFKFVDRVVLMLYYRLLGKKVVLTAHNVNAGKRDGNDSYLNRLTLRIQYLLCHHLFVHTGRMQQELGSDFHIPAHKISIIPFGINNTTPRTNLTRIEARERLGLRPDEKTLLFFGQIAPYKGLDVLVDAMRYLIGREDNVRLLIAGKVKAGCEEYWSKIAEIVATPGLRECVSCHVRFVPDAEVEAFMLASDVVVLPYRHIFQSGVPFLAYSFGLPVIATDVGALGDDIIEGRTGHLVQSSSPSALAEVIRLFFRSEMYAHSDATRSYIQAHANEKHSWRSVGEITACIYSKLSGRHNVRHRGGPCGPSQSQKRDSNTSRVCESSSTRA